MPDLYHEPQVRADHELPGLAIAFLDFRSQVDFLIRREQGNLPDLSQVNFYSSIAIFSSHITSHVRGLGGLGGFARGSGHLQAATRSRVLTFGKVFNKVKYRVSDSGWMGLVQ